MVSILNYILCCENEDIPRFIKFFEKEIASGSITEHTAMFEETKNKVKRHRNEKTEAEKILKEKGMSDLASMIIARNQKSNGSEFFDLLETKYSNKRKASDKQTPEIKKKVKGKKWLT